MNEYDVHFSLNGFFRKIEAENEEKAMEIAERWLTEARNDIETAAKTGLGIEVHEAVSPE